MTPNLTPFKNVKNGEYGQCQNEYHEAILSTRYVSLKSHSWSTFSMFEDCAGPNSDYEVWPVKYPDFNDPNIIFEGDLKVKFPDRDDKIKTLTNPMAKDIYAFFHYNNDGHHGFLEDIEWNEEEQCLEFVTGS
jgi:hypothetical protein